jgi:uncharacterized phage infection (PIP) family protein YhgE
MATQMMTYDELGALWGVSRDAARKKVESIKLPGQKGNDGKARVLIDVQEITHTPLKARKETARRPVGVQAEVDALKAHVQTLMAEVERLTALAATHRADFEQEREHAEKVAAEFAGLIDKLAEMEKWRAEKDAELARARSQADAARAALADGARVHSGVGRSGNGRTLQGSQWTAP